jgi:hypothetical protein
MSKIKAVANSVDLRAPSFSLHPHVEKGAGQLSLETSCFRSLIPFMGVKPR